VGATALATLIAVAIAAAFWLPYYYGTQSLPKNASALLAADLIAVANAMIANAVLVLLGITLSIIACVALRAGVYRVYADALAGKAKISTLFAAAKRKSLTALGASAIVFAAATALGLGMLALLTQAVPVLTGSIFSSSVNPLFSQLLVALAIILLLFLVLFLFVFPAIVVDNLSAEEAVAKSIRVARKNYPQALALFVLQILANIALVYLFSYLPPFGLAGPLVAGVLVAPVFAMSYTALYMEKRKRS
jgi:hypothetical protein